jgi:hypothetical protein
LDGAQSICAVDRDDADQSPCANRAVSLEVAMFRNHRIPSKVILAVLAIAAADIDNASAQGIRLPKPAKDGLASVLEKSGQRPKWLESELTEFADWFRPKLRLWKEKFGAWEETLAKPEEKLEERAAVEKKPSEAEAAAKAKTPPAAGALANAGQLAAIEQQAKIMHSWIDEARAQIVADLQKRVDVSEGEVAEIFERRIRAAAQTSASPPFQVDLPKLTVELVYPVDIGPVRIKPAKFDFRPLVKRAAGAYLACKAEREVSDTVKSPASSSAASAADSQSVLDCVRDSLDGLKDRIRRELKIETERGAIAAAAEKGD